SSALDGSMVISHFATLSGLAPNTTYHYRVRSRDGAGNLGASADFTFTTISAPDTTPPQITAVASSAISSSGATISWSTDAISESQVDFVSTSAYGSGAAVHLSLPSPHAALLEDLSVSSPYLFRAKSRDTLGSLAVSGDFFFLTTPALHISLQVIGS